MQRQMMVQKIMMLNILDEDIPLDVINQVQLLRSFTSDIFEQNVYIVMAFLVI